MLDANALHCFSRAQILKVSTISSGLTLLLHVTDNHRIACLHVGQARLRRSQGERHFQWCMCLQCNVIT